jgi:hypothetical protein
MSLCAIYDAVCASEPNFRKASLGASICLLWMKGILSFSSSLKGRTIILWQRRYSYSRWPGRLVVLSMRLDEKNWIGETVIPAIEWLSTTLTHRVILFYWVTAQFIILTTLGCSCISDIDAVAPAANLTYDYFIDVSKNDFVGWDTRILTWRPVKGSL